MRFREGCGFEFLTLFRHLFAVPLLLRIEWTEFETGAVSNLLKDCLSSTDNFTALAVPIDIDIVTLLFLHYVADF